jgi:UDP-GlcNAc:undecaprenyl-phosphate GlcNAc-1-phosphate transferase
MAFSITPIFRRLARKFNLFDYPGGRKLQSKPVAYLGGLAIVIPVSFSSLLLLVSGLTFEIKQQFYYGLIIPAIIISLVGLFDDIFDLHPWPRFVSQTSVGIVSSFVLYLSGGGIMLFNNQIVNSLITVLWIVFITNALNFIDNMDGLATSVSIVSSLALFILAYLNNQFIVAFLCIVIFSSCLGFFFWNKKPASIYLGDAGALYLGFLLAATSIRLDLDNDSLLVRVLVLIMILIVPAIDTTQVIFSRILRKKSPFSGGRDHISHILLDYGLSHKITLLVLISTSTFFALLAIIISETF